VKTLLVAFCPTCGEIAALDSGGPEHTRGCHDPAVEITSRLRTIRWRRERKRDGWYAEDVDYLLRVVAQEQNRG
jgi:hypothetical protein